jgi:RNA polymerase sigma factor (TIGR02999 family)
MVPAPDITTLLRASQSGDAAALEQLMDAVYPALKSLAARELRGERPDHTLQPTALVHEAYLKLFEGRPVEWQDRLHFFRVAARQMRRILISHARERMSLKRGGLLERTPLFEDAASDPVSVEEMVMLDEELERLGELDARVAEVVELRVFAGLTEEEIGEVLGISGRSVARDWKFGRAWLFDRLRPA